MTLITLNKYDGHYQVVAEGHSDKIICSAISCLLGSLKGWLNNSKCKVDESELRDGFSSIAFEGSIEAETVFDFVAIGLLELEMSYPGEVKVVY